MVKRPINIRLEECDIDKLDEIQEILSEHSKQLNESGAMPYSAKTNWTRTDVMSYMINKFYAELKKQEV